MSFAKALEEGRTETTTRRCKVGRYVSSQPASFRQDYHDYVEALVAGAPDHSVSELWRVLKRSGLGCCRATVERHLHGDCPCDV